MNVNNKILKLLSVLATLACAPTTATAQIGGSVGVGGGGVGIGVTIGGGGAGGAGPSGAPLPLLGGTVLGHAALLGAGYFGWRRRRTKSA